MANIAKTIAYVFGVVYALVGLVGFALTGFSGFTATEGPNLLFFQVNPLHNLIHLAIGVALVAAAAASGTALRAVTGAVAVVLALVGALGFFIINSPLNILALNAGDNLLHLATAGVLFVTMSQARRPATV
ncbi:MAG: DUF4383 domain-containing protein [Acidimicrobiia bacterium]